MHHSEPGLTREQLLKALEEKYASHGQDLNSYLEGMIHADYLSYWDYIHLDTLLSLQNPRTVVPDELIFIMYHQATELFFKMILLEMQQISAKENLDEAFFAGRLDRINRYMDILVQSFDVMGVGMEEGQFRKFRKSLQPASGFQSAQFRMIEIRATSMNRLVDKEFRQRLSPDASIEELYQHIYWKQGATELATGKKTLTLQKFEEKYDTQLLNLALQCRDTNLSKILEKLIQQAPLGQPLVDSLRTFDLLVNVHWPLAHFRSAMHYLHQGDDPIAATGGTNWEQYLPPFFQKRIFYPQLWTDEEKLTWGKDWVEKNVFKGKR
jgi:tryptophan 2,3-dioxygenase